MGFNDFCSGADFEDDRPGFDSNCVVISANQRLITGFPGRYRVRGVMLPNGAPEWHPTEPNRRMEDKFEPFDLRAKIQNINRLLEQTDEHVVDPPVKKDPDQAADFASDRAPSVSRPESVPPKDTVKPVDPPKPPFPDDARPVPVSDTVTGTQPPPSTAESVAKAPPRQQSVKKPDKFAALKADELADIKADSLPEMRRKDRVLARLLTTGLVREDHVRVAWEEWKKMRKDGLRAPLWRVLTLSSEINRELIYAEAAKVYAFDEAKIDEAATLSFLQEIANFFTEDQWDQMIEFFILPIAQEKEPYRGEIRWIFATHDPTRPEVHRLLQQLLLKRFELRYAPENVIASLITDAFLSKNEYLDRLNDDPMAFDLGTSFDNTNNGLIDEDALEAEISRSTLINLFEASLVDAVHKGASDIHIFPNPDRKVEIHFRVDGELERWHIEDRVHPEAFLAVVKDNAINVDRFDREIAQDGFIQRWVDGALIRFRVSVLPIASAAQELRAESIVIRVLDDRKILTDLRNIGLLDVALERFDKAIRQPHGMVILTGPTGSGKSTTLVAALYQVVTPKVNVLTVEDPVEYIIRGVRQIKLGSRLGLEGALRAILRHDPDVVMVGEMRDRATAELAIKLANTGHLTFSTLHTNDAPSAVSRLFKMGVEPFLIAYAINLVVAQRLLRKLCPECKQKDTAPDYDLISYMGIPREQAENMTIYKEGDNSQCSTCHGTGFKGRRAIAETLLFTKEIRRLIMSSEEMVDEDALRQAATDEGMLSLKDSAMEVFKEGDTSIEEVIRVTGGTL